MQKSIIVSIVNGGNSASPKELNTLLSDGWNVVLTEQFRPSIGGQSNTFTLGSILVILEKE